jgi:hypothetical protein
MDLESYASRAMRGMAAIVFSAGLVLSLSGDIGTAWRWLIFAQSACGVTISLMFAAYVDRGQMGATQKSTSTDPRA